MVAASVSMAVPAASPRRPPPLRERGIVRWLRANLFNNIHNTILTLLCLWALAIILPPVLRWALFDAVWTSADGAECRSALGACWAVVAEKYRLILFGTFPYQEHWRGWLVILIVVGLAIVSAFRRLWSWQLFLAWVVGMGALLVVVLGG